jgi:hypothetical protein
MSSVMEADLNPPDTGKKSSYSQVSSPFHEEKSSRLVGHEHTFASCNFRGRSSSAIARRAVPFLISADEK